MKIFGNIPIYIPKSNLQQGTECIPEASKIECGIRQ